jgi:WD40 repeat protein
VARIWDANEPFKSVRRLPTTDDTEAFKIAFSPDGALLAAAGPDAVTVWDVEKREVPVASWRAKQWPDDKWNPAVNGEFSLGWDSDSSRLSIALGNQVRNSPFDSQRALMLYDRSRSSPSHGNGGASIKRCQTLHDKLLSIPPEQVQASLTLCWGTNGW